MWETGFFMVICVRYRCVGVPYFFHALSGTDMEIRSAGLDWQMWNADEVTIE